MPKRWFGRGCFACDQCGDFPDFHGLAASAHAAAPPEDPKPAMPAGSRNRPRVLIVDDSTEHNELCALLLERIATVITASRGDVGLALACADPPDAVVLDVMMPGMDGWQVCDRLKANSATAAVPIIMLTSLDEVDVPERAYTAGAVAVLTKPCPFERLQLTIENAIRERKAVRE